jgi:hypothetical protein
MAIQSLKQQGYLIIDHQASPGLSEADALKAGLDPKLVGEGKVFEADTLTCAHCKTTQVKNTLRTRARSTCAKCNHHYICDLCAARAQAPDYTHFPYDKFRDLTMDGYQLAHAIGVPMQLGSSPGLIMKPTSPTAPEVDVNAEVQALAGDAS